MVSRASAVSCHPLPEVPSLRRRGSTRQWLVGRALLLVAVRARTLLASTAGARFTDHAAIVSAKQSAAESLVDVQAPSCLRGRAFVFARGHEPSAISFSGCGT